MTKNNRKYLYRCQRCGEEFLVAHSLPHTAECPGCRAFLKLVRSPMPSLSDIITNDSIVSIAEKLAPMPDTQHTLLCSNTACGYRAAFQGPPPSRETTICCPNCSSPMNRRLDYAIPDEQKESVKPVIHQRSKTHGESFLRAAAFIQYLKGMVHTGDKWDRLNADQQESLDMICTKIGRILNGDPDLHDHWLDISGYALLIADRLKP